MQAIRTVLGLLGVFVAAASTFVGTCIAYIVFRWFWGAEFHWWLNLPIAVLFVLVWHWGGLFLSTVLVAVSLPPSQKPPQPPSHTPFPKEVEAVWHELEQAAHRFDSPAFAMIRGLIEKVVLSDPAAVAATIREGTTPRQSVYCWIVNITGDCLESGDFHIYRGVLDPSGFGEDFLRIFDAASVELVRLGAVDAEYAQRQRSALRENIAKTG